MDKLQSHGRARKVGYPTLVFVAGVFLLAGMLIASSTGSTKTAQAGPVPAINTTVPSFVDLAEAVGPSVVNIRVTKIQRTDLPSINDFDSGPFGDMFKEFFGDMARRFPRQYKSRGAGSGVIVNADGTILTNSHVVEGASEIMITLNDKQEYKAHVVGRDQKTDLAVIKVDAKARFHAARLGDSEALRVGEWVLAVGNPFGLSNTVTSGIVSAKGRIIGAGPYDDFIQTDAPINPGNSGGPLFNMRGEVIGINTAIVPNGQGIGFAIPINTAKNVLPELVSKGKVSRGYLGVNIQNVTQELASSLGLKNTRGALVSQVRQDSPAERAGIRQGDVIIAYDRKDIKDSHELAAVVAATPIGKTVPVKFIRDGKEMTANVRTGDLAMGEMKADEKKMAGVQPEGKWGIEVRDLTPEFAQRLGLKRDKGVVIVGVRQGSPAEDASLQKGDLVLEVNRQPVKTAEEMQERIKKVDKNSLLLLIQRGDGTMFLVLKAEK
ncbi:MAG TPA: peptidase [Deltaproteobacteria bacterium]|nr:peptidase [Deltaproteobacteria bacterium]